MDSGGLIPYNIRDRLLGLFKEYDGGNILLGGDGREFLVRGAGKVQVHMRDGSSFVLDNVRYIPELRRNLISLGTLEKEGFTVKMQTGKIKVIKGSLVGGPVSISPNKPKSSLDYNVKEFEVKGLKHDSIR
ncbi:hypothetical protein Tco_1139144 [Tanacetum coccineum]